MATVTRLNGHDSLPRTKKRLIVCCDGTWMDSDKGYAKPDKQHPLGGLQSPSNVTRISRCFKRRCSDGTLQVMSYESGVGTGGAIDTLTGGLFGQGLSERVREAYSYLCANYADGDEIVLVGFSRGAFTVRSVAGMVDNLGLLTREGVESFYPIFKDMQNWREPNYQDPFPKNPFPRKPKGPGAADEYRRRLEERGLTRVFQQNGRLITIKAVGVWDTVGSLGIPQVSWLNKLGYRPANEEYRWHDTGLSDCIEHAFQALALDETRSPFSPAVWEMRSRNKPTTDLRQVWFPGNHGNCGGGWDDQSMSNITLAWMMDQLASVGVEFDTPSLERIFDLTIQFFEDQAHQDDVSGVPPGPKWAINPIYRNNAPIRPWSLGAIQSTTGMLTKLSGTSPRTPGLYRQSGHRDGRFLQDTNERIHSSVRTRLACQGLGLNDKGVWTCPALGPWRLRRTSTHYSDPIPTHPSWEMGDCDRDSRRFPGAGGQRWIWQYAGSSRDAPTDPKQRIMVEEPLGPYERYLLHLSGGSPNVYEFAEAKGARRRGGDSERTSRHESEERHGRRRRSEAVGYYDSDGRPPPERRHSSRPPERQSYDGRRFDGSPEDRRYPPDALYERRRTRRVYSEQFYDDRRG